MARRSPRKPSVEAVAPAGQEFSKPPSWLRPVILAMAALVLLGWFSTESADSDTWWHLKTGEYILRNHALPVPDPFSYTAYMGKPAYPGEETTRDFNLKHEWLAQVMFYLAYAAAGFPGLVLLRVAILSAYCLLAGLVVFRRTGGFYRALIAAGLSALVAGFFLSDRPYQLTYLLLAATLAILEFRRWLWLLPAMMLVWANLHGGFFLGLIVLGVYCAEVLFLRWQKRPLPDEKTLWLVSAACLVAAAINPNGYLTLPVLIAYRESQLQRTLYEWAHGTLWPPNLISCLLFAAAGALVWQRPKTRLTDWLLLGLFGAAYVSAVRNSNLVGLIAPIAIASYVPWKWRVPVAAEFAAAALILALFGAERVEGRGLEFRAAEWKYPSGAADFLLSHRIAGRVFNSYEKGGYLIWRLWPQQRVFVDGRALNESVYGDYQRIMRYASAADGPSAHDLLDRYGIEVILVNGFEVNSGNPYALPLALADPSQGEHKEWNLVYEDGQALIFMRHPPPDVPSIPSQQVFASLESQCRVILENDPLRPRCARGLGRLYARMGDAVRARQWMGLFLERRQDHDPLDDELFRRLNAATP